MRPVKGKRDFVIKCKWKTLCEFCWTEIDKICEKESRESPSLQDKEFLVPYYVFDWQCPHKTTKPYLFESVYGERKTTT